VGRYTLELGQQPEAWLADRALTDPGLVHEVASWTTHVVCDDTSSFSAVQIQTPAGQIRWVARVPDTKVDVTWLVANPLRTVKVLWIEEDRPVGHSG
jgi:hypothetical protein